MATPRPFVTIDPILAALRERPSLACDLRRDERDPLLVFLANWGPPEVLLACAEALVEGSPRLIVSSLDLRARALLALGQPAAAVDTMRHRLTQKDSITGRLLLVRALLAAGDRDAARQTAEAMAAEEPSSPAGWQALAQVALAAGDGEAALAYLRRLGEAVPGHRSYLFGMARAHAARQDWVTATSFAVGLLTAAAERFRLQADELRQLQQLFQAAGEATRARDIEEQLADRFAEDSERLAAAFAEWLGQAGTGEAAPTAPEAADRVAASEPMPVPGEIGGRSARRDAREVAAAEPVPVSDEERARIAKAARDLFGFTTMLPGQMETIACALRGESVLTVLPTGGGKSLCFQLPAFLTDDGTTLVVSPSASSARPACCTAGPMCRAASQ